MFCKTYLVLCAFCKACDAGAEKQVKKGFDPLIMWSKFDRTSVVTVDTVYLYIGDMILYIDNENTYVLCLGNCNKITRP